MEVNGTIKFIGQTVDVGTSGFQKRELVVTTDEQYPQHILLNFVQAKCNDLDSYFVGDKVTVGINLRGREWVNPEGKTKYFNDIQGWNIKKTTNSTPANPASATPAKKYVHTATDATYEAYKNAGWNDERLVSTGKGRFEAITPPPAPTAPAPVQTDDSDLPF